MSELLTIVARALDGLILSETWENSSEMEIVKSKAKKVLGRLQNAPPKMSIEAGDYTFHYVIENGVCILTAASKNFPKRIVFAFLDDTMRAFNEELKRVLGPNVDYRSYVETITKPYVFITFDRTVQRKRAEYRDPDSAGNKALGRVNEGLLEINSIMKKSLDEMLLRGEALDDVGRRADDLKEASKKFAKQAYNLNLQALLRKYGIVGVIILGFLLIIWFRFF